MFPGLIQTFGAKSVLASLASIAVFYALALLCALAVKSMVEVLYRHDRKDMRRKWLV